VACQAADPPANGDVEPGAAWHPHGPLPASVYNAQVRSELVMTDTTNPKEMSADS
jgi:hypothetical protein